MQTWAACATKTLEDFSILSEVSPTTKKKISKKNIILFFSRLDFLFNISLLI
jgi:hypothetical protein